jgi:hypothetical protein
MATNYPNSLDILVNPTVTDTLNSPTVPHVDQHANANDAIEAIQTVLGVNPAGSYLTVKDRIVNTETLISNQSVLNGLADITISEVNAGDVLRYNAAQSKWVNDSQENLVDGGSF